MLCSCLSTKAKAEKAAARTKKQLEKEANEAKKDKSQTPQTTDKRKSETREFEIIFFGKSERHFSSFIFIRSL